MKLKLQQIILSIVGFIVVLLVSVYLLSFLAKDLFPDAGEWVIYGIPELSGLVLAIIAAYLCWKFAGRIKPDDE
jgi:membrane protein DedA with SNARE-associated domain